MAERYSQGQLSAATPVYILRGHAAPIHALHIFSQNLRLVSGDAEGWVVIWDLVTKRPVTVWKAHEGAVLELKAFQVAAGTSEIYTHGRDHKLCVWKLRAEDEAFLDKTLPVDVAESNRSKSATQPWLLHSLPVNALNFCAFSMSFLDISTSASSQSAESTASRVVLFAVPNALDSGGIDIFHLPSERRITTIASDPATKTGMVMAVNLFTSSSGDVYVVSAYEDGHVMVFIHGSPLTPASFDIDNVASNPWKWDKLYASRPHSQPVLSLDVSPARDYFITSSADALLVKHPIPGPSPAGHIPTANYMEDSPLKSVNTKHSGQQGLRMRSDGKIFATAGWDSRVRVYSGKTMKELAVLKWHKEGCYTVAFADPGPSSQPAAPAQSQEPTTLNEPNEPGAKQVTSGQSLSLAAIHNQRNRKVQQTHWLAAGSKDGKISLWDIY